MNRKDAVKLLSDGIGKLKRLRKAELRELWEAIGIEPPQAEKLTRGALLAWIEDVVIPRALNAENVSPTSRKSESKVKRLEAKCKELGIPFENSTDEHLGQTTIILIPNRPKDPVKEAEEALTEHSDPDVEFIAVLDQERVVLQIGRHVSSQFEDMSDDDIAKEAEERGYLESVEGGCVDESGVVDITKCRESLMYDEECGNIAPATSAYPCGRAYDFFCDLDADIPGDIGLKLFEWGHLIPVYVASIPDPAASVKLQSFLSGHGINANFRFAKDWEVWGI